MGLLQNGCVDVLGHSFGVYSRYFNTFPENCMRQLMIESLEKGIAIEINTKYKPNMKKMFNLLRKVNPYVSFGSDAHKTSEIAGDFDIIRRRIAK